MSWTSPPARTDAVRRPPNAASGAALTSALLGGLAALCLSLSGTACAQADEPPDPAASRDHGRQADYGIQGELLLAVRLNGVPLPDDEHIGVLGSGRLAASTGTLQRWNLRPPSTAPVAYLDESYYPLDDIPGLDYRVDEATQELQLEIPTSAFLSNSFNAAGRLQRNPAVSPGGFFNYDLLTQRSPNDQFSSGLIEAGAFNRHGVGTGTFLWKNRGMPHDFTRLETSWTHDDADSMSRIQLGDGISRAGAWGRAIRFGGLQWRTNFDTQPGFITFPQPSASGLATLPSTVDVYINNTQRLSHDVQPGPFEISNIPVITGAGEVQLVVRDLLGRQQVITQPYYSSPSLLRAGLSDYSYEAGFTRQDYSLLSNHYGAPFASATHRRGMSNRFTRELRAEVQAGQQTAGLGGIYLWPGLGTAQVAFAASHGPTGNGTLFIAGAEHTGRQFSWSIQDQISSSRFTEVGWVSGDVRPRRTQSLRVGFPLGAEGGSLSLSHINQQYWGQPGTRIWSASYSRNLFGDFVLSMYATQSMTVSGTNRSIGFSISHYFGDRVSAGAQFNRQDRGNGGLVQIQQSPPEGPGFGYRLASEEGINRRQEATGSWQTDVGTYTAGASQQTGNASTQLGASGGIAFLGGETFASRRIDESFAVVNAGGYPGVHVYHEGRPAGVTDEKGQALIPHLRPYQQNRISVEESDLPIEAQAERLELEVTPALRSGTYAELPIKATRGGTLVIVLEDGSFIPSGAVVMMLDREEEFPVGMRGEVFLPDLGESNELLVSWKGRGCQINVRLPPGSPPLADLGKQTCEGVRP